MMTPAELEEQVVRRLSILEQGVIHKDSLIQISMKSQFAEGKGNERGGGGERREE
jgi:hypothetical protein